MGINNLSKPTPTATWATIQPSKMMTKTIVLFTVACILLSNVVCNVLSDIHNDTDLEDLVTRVEISNNVLDTSEPADRTIVCQISSQLKCGTACSGQPCTATCTGTCGFLLPRKIEFKIFWISAKYFCVW